MRAALDPSAVRKLACPPGERKVLVWDSTPSSPSGFGLRIRAGGGRSYVLAYRTRTGTQRTMRVGLPKDLTLAAAREAARKLLERVAAGEDPALDRRRDTDALTVGVLVTRYAVTRTRSGRPRARRTSAGYKRQARRISSTSLGRTRADALTAAVLESWLEKRAEAAPISADRDLALIRAAFRWGLRKGLVDVDPTVRLDRVVKQRSRDRVLSDQEVKDLYTGVAAAEARQLDEEGPRLSHVQAAALKALLLLGQRLDETLRMTWESVDLTAGLWSIPAAARKGDKPHVVPLSPMVAKVLEGLATEADRRGPVFRGGRGKAIAHNPNRFARAIRAAAPGVTGWKLHDLRRTCASGCARLGTTMEVVKALLGHQAAGVTAIYQRHGYLPEVAAALSTWQGHVLRVAEGRATANVLPMRRTRRRP